jgi:hypothetical protein
MDAQQSALQKADKIRLTAHRDRHPAFAFAKAEEIPAGWVLAARRILVLRLDMQRAYTHFPVSLLFTQSWPIRNPH